MAEPMNKVVYYHSLLNFLNVVETCPRNLRKDLKENEYAQAFAILDYNSQWVEFAPLSKEIKERLLKAAKNPESRERLRRVIKRVTPKRNALSVEDLLKKVGE